MSTAKQMVRLLWKESIHALCLSADMGCWRSGVGVFAVLSSDEALCSGCRGVAIASSNKWSAESVLRKSTNLYHKWWLPPFTQFISFGLHSKNDWCNLCKSQNNLSGIHTNKHNCLLLDKLLSLLAGSEKGLSNPVFSYGTHLLGQGFNSLVD